MPDIPTNLTAETNGEARIEVSWGAPADGLPSDGYELEIETLTLTLLPAPIVRETFHAIAVMFTHKYLRPNTAYQYRIRALGTDPSLHSAWTEWEVGRTAHHGTPLVHVSGCAMRALENDFTYPGLQANPTRFPSAVLAVSDRRSVRFGEGDVVYQFIDMALHSSIQEETDTYTEKILRELKRYGRLFNIHGQKDDFYTEKLGGKRIYKRSTVVEVRR